MKVEKNANEISTILDVEASERIGLLRAMSCNKWLDLAEKMPMPKMLFDCLWYEGEVCIMFADTNLGKSCLAVQVGNSISTGEMIPGFHLEMDPQPIIYFDFELTEKQFYIRYSSVDSKYQFSDSFCRTQIDAYSLINYDESKDFEVAVAESMEQTIIEKKAKLVIIDNLTYIKSRTEKAEFAAPLMKQLIKLKIKYDLSMMILAHTPKRDLYKEISRNDLQGSKMLINFCDSAFAIGESHSDSSIRYIKQIKARNCEVKYDTDNVIVCQLLKDDNFLKFNFINYASEREFLKRPTDEDKAKRKEQAQEMKDEGLSNREIARQLNVSEGAVRKWFK